MTYKNEYRVISNPDEIIRRLRSYAEAFGSPATARIYATASYEKALKSTTDKPAAFLRFDGISPVGAELMQVSEGSFQQRIIENWQLIIIGAPQENDDSGAAMQLSLMHCIESAARALTAWAPGNKPGSGQPGSHWRPPCQFDSGWIHDEENGGIIAATMNIQILNHISSHDGFPAATTDLAEIRLAGATPAGSEINQSTKPPESDEPTPASPYTAISSYGEAGNADRQNYADNKENRAELSHESGITIRSDGGFQFPDADTNGAGLVLPLSAADLANTGDMLVMSFIARRGPTASYQTVLQALAGIYDGGDEDILQFSGNRLLWETAQVASADTNPALIAADTELTVSAMVTAGSLQGNKRNATIKIAISGGGDSWVSAATAGSFYEFGATRPFAQFAFGGQGSHSFDGYIKNIKIARITTALTDDELQVLTPDLIR